MSNMSSRRSRSGAKKKKEMSNGKNSFPLDMMAEILAQLPVKSLVRFRCVSKLSNALIGHPKFAKMHLSKTLRTGVVLPSNTLYSMDLATLSSANKLVAVEDKVVSEILVKNRRKSVSVLGYSNGLLCLKVGTSIVFYNPSTKKYKKITDFETNYLRCGFGYVESVDDFKYVKISNNFEKIVVYSVRKKSKKEIKNDFRFDGLQMSAISVNTALHWLVYDERKVYRSIAAFDLVEEKFKTLSPPDIIIPNATHCYSLEVFDGHLSWVINENHHTIQFWVMMEYGVKESWMKILTIQGHSGHRQFTPLCFLNNHSGSILARIDLEHLKYLDPEDMTVKDIEVEGIKGDVILPRVYVENLVSPFSKTKKELITEAKYLGSWIE